MKRPFQSDGEKKVTGITKLTKRSFFIVSVALAVVGIIYSGKLPIRTSLNEGDIASEDIYAPFAFKYKPGIDEEKTREKQESVLGKVLDVYSIDSNILEKAQADARVFFEELLLLKKPEMEISDAGIDKIIKDRLASSLNIGDVRVLLAYLDINLLRDELISLLKEAYSYPIISDDVKKALRDLDKKRIQIFQQLAKERAIKEVDDIYSFSDLHKITESIISKSKIDDKNIKKVFNKLMPVWIKPNLVFNPGETEVAKKEALSLIAPVYAVLERAKGEIIIRRGQKVTRDHLMQLDMIRSMVGKEDRLSQLGGIIILISPLTFLLLIYLKYFEPKTFSEDKLLMLIGLLLLFAAIFGRVIVSSPLPSYFVPVAAVSMLLTLLINGNVAAIVVMAASVIVALIAGVKFNIFLVSIVGGISAICAVNKARHRSQIIRAGFFVSVLNFITICGIGILSNFKTEVFLRESLWGIASGITAAGITMVFLPALESIFKLTTNIKLLELADLNHPILKSMVTKATGTYHHSLVVGNLAESAADAIGANSLLARIGAYYHDIGKIEKAEYFAENKQIPADMHENLSPSMSSLIITNHVKDGVELAEKYKLGPAIKDIIEQHHGSSLVTYFFHQAIEKTQDEKPVSDEGFRYLGPKPQTKESAIVMLADSVEAASRVFLQNASPQRLKELVRKIINDKFIDRQLSECELTLKDINNIADSFVKILMGIYHSRVEYPSATADKHGNNNNKRSKKDKA